MYNDRLSSEEAKERITERLHEVESYSAQSRLGFGEGGGMRWFFILVVLGTAVAVLLL